MSRQSCNALLTSINHYSLLFMGHCWKCGETDHLTLSFPAKKAFGFPIWVRQNPPYPVGAIGSVRERLETSTCKSTNSHTSPTSERFTRNMICKKHELGHRKIGEINIKSEGQTKKSLPKKGTWPSIRPLLLEENPSLHLHLPSH